MLVSIALTAVGTLLLVGGGVLWGRNLAGCAELKSQFNNAEVHRLEAERALENERHQREALTRELASARAAADALRQDNTRLIESAGRSDDAVARALAPLMQYEKSSQELVRLQGGDGLKELPAILSTIAEVGGFSAVLLSDESGLPIAQSEGDSGSIENAAGVFSLLLMMSDRLEHAGSAGLRSIIIRDAEERLSVHRIFNDGEHRYLLSAATRSTLMVPAALDPAIDSVRSTLSRRRAA